MHIIEPVSVKFNAPFDWYGQSFNLFFKRPFFLIASTIVSLIVLIALVTASLFIGGQVLVGVTFNIGLFAVYGYFAVAAEMIKIDTGTKLIVRHCLGVLKRRWRDIGALSLLSVSMSSLMSLICYTFGLKQGSDSFALATLVYFYFHSMILWFAPYLVVCKGASWSEAVKANVSSTLKNKAMMFVLLFIALVLMLVSGLTLMVFSLMMAPVIVMAANYGGKCIFKDSYVVI